MERLENLKKLNEEAPHDLKENETKEEEFTSTIMIKSLFENRPAVVQFQFDKAFLQKKTNRSFEIDWSKKENHRFSIFYKSYKNEPDCIKVPAKINGIKRTKNFFQGNLIWKLMTIDKMTVLMKKLNKYQRYNHFPLTWEIGRKDNLYRNYEKMKKEYPDDYDFCPETYILPESKDKFTTAFRENPENSWIIKPVASSRGRGIRLLSNFENIPKRCLISNYISNPHLINNKKYDLRLYVVITSFSPLKIYLYDEGLIRFACEEYNLSNETRHNRFVHLTNYSINKNSSNFDKNVSVNDELSGSKWSLTALKTYFKENSLDFNSLFDKIKDIVVKSVLTIADDSIKTVKKLTPYSNNLFELYGYDILIDSEFRPWLMEINLNPSLNVETKLDYKIKSMLLSDIFTLIGIVPYYHEKGEREILGDFDFGKDEKNYRLKKFQNKNYKDYINNEEDEESSSITKRKEVKLMGIQNCLKTASFKVVDEDLNLGNFNLEKFLENKENAEIIMDAEDEFHRKGNFNLLFPLSQNINTYSKFMKRPGVENIAVWKWILKGKPLDQLERKFYDSS